MRPKSELLLLICLLAAAPLLRAEGALYSVKIAAAPSFEVVAAPNIYGQLSMFPFSEMMAKGMQKPGGRKVIAADYAAGFVCIRTKEPSVAVQDIANQITRQTGLMLKKHVNSALAVIAPTTILQAFSDTAVITLVLTPKEPDVYLVSCSYLIEERPEGSNDGTPAALAQMEETMRLLSADSTATTLPSRIALKDVQLGEYFRGAQQFQQPEANGQFFPAVILMLKKGNDYTVAWYRNENGLLIMLDQPVALSATHSPFITNLPDAASAPAGTPVRPEQIRLGLRANRIDGPGGYYLSFENGRMSKKEF